MKPLSIVPKNKKARRVVNKKVTFTDPVAAVCDEIDSIFSDEIGSDVILLSTIHKSKGREWNTVIWLQTGPSKWARKDWELQQEDNLCYVASTRAKQRLVLAEMESKKK